MSVSTFDKVRVPIGVYFNETGHISDTDYISYKFPNVGSLKPEEIKPVEAPTTSDPGPSPDPKPSPGPKPGSDKDNTLLSLILNPVTLLVISIIILLVLIFNENKNVMYY